MMKRPSNVLLAFTLTVASSLAIWIAYLFVLEANQFIRIQLKETYESQVEE